MIARSIQNGIPIPMDPLTKLPTIHQKRASAANATLSLKFESRIPITKASRNEVPISAIQEKLLVYQLCSGLGEECDFGLGSIILNLLLIAMYYNETQGHKLVVDQSALETYRLNVNHGLFTGYFDTTFAALDSDKERKRRLGKISEKKKKEVEIITLGEDSFLNAREEASDHFDTESSEFFRHMSSVVCDSIKINNPTQKRIRTLLRRSSIPEFFHGDGSKSVSFHIRRGDKVTSGESRAFEANEYAEKLLKVHRNVTEVTQCFLATDDYTVVSELETALRKRSVGCNKLHTLASGKYTSKRDGYHTVLFLAELTMLVDATYFIGTVNSNVGSLTSFNRGCREDRRDGESETNRYNHYYGSHFVDEEEWYLQ